MKQLLRIRSWSDLTAINNFLSLHTNEYEFLFRGTKGRTESNRIVVFKKGSDAPYRMFIDYEMPPFEHNIVALTRFVEDEHLEGYVIPFIINGCGFKEDYFTSSGLPF